MRLGSGSCSIALLFHDGTDSAVVAWTSRSWKQVDNFILNNFVGIREQF
jgi:hypothetical protein